MKPVIDVVIDIETLGTGVNAKIIGIGVVAVVDGVLPQYTPAGLQSSLITDSIFHLRCDIDGDNSRRSTTDSTLEFWDQQDYTLHKFYIAGEVPLRVALYLLSDFIKSLSLNGTVRPWGNGSVFDISTLEHAYKQCGLEIPWSFRNIRDVRTRKEDALFIAEVAGIETDIPFEGVKHYALDDAYHEAKILVKSRQIISDAAEALKDLKEFNK